MNDSISRFDHNVTELIDRLPSGLHSVMEAASLIGEPIVVLIIAGVIALTSLFKGAPRIFIAECLGVVAFGINTLIKFLVHRARPTTYQEHEMLIKSYSFPSSHAFVAMFFYGLLAYLVFKYLPRRWNIVALVTLISLILLIGVSRVYLGAHFPTDVLAGWLFGGGCLALVIRYIKP